MAKRIGRGELDVDERELYLREARTYAGYAIRLGVGDARERFLELHPEAEHAADHYEFNEIAHSLAPDELREIVEALHGKGPGNAILRALELAEQPQPLPLTRRRIR